MNPPVTPFFIRPSAETKMNDEEKLENGGLWLDGGTLVMVRYPFKVFVFHQSNPIMKQDAEKLVDRFRRKKDWRSILNMYDGRAI